ncbi:hypothetical protein EI94DRAFT_1295223 [Lactarius quietus]|nr:hypothetical protein EI94DRAFT_1295223 [Lactarius quietus]
MISVNKQSNASRTSGCLAIDDTDDSAAAADVDLLLSPADESGGPFLQPDRTPSTSVLLQNCTALQEELAGQLAQMAGQLRRNAEHFYGALVADQAVLRAADEKVGANLDAMKLEHVRLRDHHGKALGTTSPMISSVLVVAIAFLLMFFAIRFT